MPETSRTPEGGAAGLTPRQRDALAFIARYQGANESAPSLQEIADDLGMRSKSQAHYIVRKLEQRGAIRRLHGQRRSIRIIRPAPGRPASVELVRAVARLLDTIRREDPDAGFAVVDADALGGLDIAYREHLDSAEARAETPPGHGKPGHGKSGHGKPGHGKQGHGKQGHGTRGPVRERPARAHERPQPHG